MTLLSIICALCVLAVGGAAINLFRMPNSDNVSDEKLWGCDDPTCYYDYPHAEH